MDRNFSRGRRLVQAVLINTENKENDTVENRMVQTKDFPITSKENTKDYLRTIPQTQETLPLIVLTGDACYTEDVTLNSVDNEELHRQPKDLNRHCNLSPEEEVLPILLELAQHTSSESLKNETVDVTDPNNHNMNEGRKRRKKADPTQWKRNINKKLRMEGKEYVGFRKAGTTVIQDVPREERKMKPTCGSTACVNSKKRNCQLFTEEQREVIYERFWGLTWGERKSLICGYVTKVAKKTNTTDCDSRRNFTLIYHLNNGQETYQVCRNMFVNTLGIGYRMVQSWVTDGSHGIPVTLKNKNTPVNYMVRSQLELLTNFFDSLPKMPSHYNRQNSSKLYLEPVFQTIKDVYKLYLAKCNEARQSSFSRKKFCEVMNSNNISLFKVKKDKCNLCTSYETGNVQEDAWKEHVEKKERARKEKREDIEKANRGEIILLEVDFQAVKLAPFTHSVATLEDFPPELVLFQDF
ncbi:hypothetical protein ACJJTC_005795 [Scirpophaga incertulas]